MGCRWRLGEAVFMIIFFFFFVLHPLTPCPNLPVCCTSRSCLFLLADILNSSTFFLFISPCVCCLCVLFFSLTHILPSSGWHSRNQEQPFIECCIFINLMYSKNEDYCRKKDAVAITIPAGYPSSTAMPAVSGGGGGPRRAVLPPPAPSRTATSSMTTAAIDLNALSLCISCSPSDGEKKHAPHPSIDVNKCKRKLSLYGDYNQVNQLE